MQARPLPAQQRWVQALPIMQQSVLFSAIRGPDGVRKHHPVKALLRWYRRCVLLSAFDGRALDSPFEAGGGSFTGPFTTQHARAFVAPHLDLPDVVSAFDRMRAVYLEYVDELPHHFQLHFMHAAQIVSVHHPREATAKWWRDFYLMIVNDAHLHPETDQKMNERLSDFPGAWRRREMAAFD
ncbi:MAG: hypothetical protein AAFX81_16060 [Pseudomonadota bacterium]